MCCREDFGVDVTIAAADAVACRCGDACLVEGARRLRRALDESPAVFFDGGEGDWVLDATEAGGDVD